MDGRPFRPEVLAPERGNIQMKNLPKFGHLGVLGALGVEVLFGGGTPLAELLPGNVSPWTLAGLFYLGSLCELGFTSPSQAASCRPSLKHMVQIWSGAYTCALTFKVRQIS
jgi:hypothetical protein